MMTRIGAGYNPDRRLLAKSLPAAGSGDALPPSALTPMQMDCIRKSAERGHQGSIDYLTAHGVSWQNAVTS